MKCVSLAADSLQRGPQIKVAREEESWRPITERGDLERCMVRGECRAIGGNSFGLCNCEKLGWASVALFLTTAIPT